MTKEQAIEYLKADIKHWENTSVSTEHLEMAIKSLEQQPSDDCVSRTQAIEWIENLRQMDKCFGNYEDDYFPLSEVIDRLKNMPPVTPTRKIGRWIYNRDIDNWVCSECGETPKTLGYCGTSAFMTEHFKFCNHCGAEMVGAENG